MSGGVEVGGVRANLTLDNNQFRVAVADTGNQLRSIQRELNNTAASTQKMEDYFLSAATKFRHFIQFAGSARFAMMDFNDVFLRLPQSILQTSGEIERMTKLIAGMSTQSTEAARNLEAQLGVKYIIDLAKQAPFSVKSLQDTFVKLKAGGIDPMNGSMEALVNNLAKFGGTSDEMHRVAIAIQQMAGKGVISMEELRQQLGEAMPNAMRLMAEGMGMTIQEMVKHISKGQVQSADALRRMFTVMRVEAAGAAADMMNTWTGLIARLETEWSLFKKNVGDKGFFDSAKQQLQQIVDFFGTGSMLKLAADLGEALKNLVVDLAEVAKFVHDHADAFMTAAKAVAFYLTATRLVFPVIKAMQTEWGAMTGIWNAEVAARQRFSAQYAEASAMDIAVDRQRLAAKLAIQAQELSALQQGLTQQVNAHIVTGQRILDLEDQRAASLRAKRAGGAALRADIDRELSNYRMLDAAQTKQIATTRAEIAALNAQALATREATVANAALTAETAALTGAQTAATGAMGLLRAGFAALGGWPMLITIGITALIYKFYDLAHAADEAAAASRRAAQGVSGPDDLKTHESTLANVQREMENNANAIELMRAQAQSSGVKSDADNLKRMEQHQKDLARQEGELLRDIGRTKMNIAQQVADDALRAETIRQDREIANAEIAGKRLRDAQTEKGKQELEGLKEGSKEYETAFKAQIDAQRDVIAQAAKLKLAAVQKAQTEVDSQIKALDGKTDRDSQAQLRGYLERSKTLQTQVEQAQQFIKDAQHLPEKPDIGQAKEKLHTPLERAIEHEEANLAQLKVRLENLKNNATGMAALRAEYDAEVHAAAKGKAYDYQDPNDKNKVIKPEEKDLQLLIDLKTQNKLIDDALKLRQKMLETTKNDPAYQSAIDVIRNPLGDVKDGTALASAKKVIADIEKDSSLFQAMLVKIKETGLDYEAWKKQFLAQQAAVDLAPEVQKAAQQTQTINANLIDDTRQRTRALYDIETRNLTAIQEARLRALAGTEDAEKQSAIARMTFAEQMHAREMQMLRETETPMQKLAREWQNTTQEMQQASTSWANGVVDVIVKMVKTGKLEFGSLVESILTDLLKIQLQQRIAKPLNGAIDMGIEAIGKYFNSGSTMSDTTVGSGFGDIGSFMNFADGGIMSEYGRVPLRMYADGGIANRPQMSVFGEGSRPEAYVPLPDGRSIPVTMQGGGAPNIQLNIINQTSTPVTAQQSSRFDGERMILDVVLKGVNTPGPFRDGVKSAVAA